MTPDEFAAKIKAKYPQYKDMDNNELSRKIVSKHPEYSSQVDFSGTTMGQAFQKAGVHPMDFLRQPNTEFDTGVMAGIKGQEIKDGTFPQKAGQFIGKYGPSMVGGAALTAATGGGAIPAMAASALGGGAGEAYRQIASKLLGGKSPETSTEAAGKIGEQALSQGLAEGATRGLKAVGEYVAPTGKKIASQLLQGLQKIPKRYADAIIKDPDILFRKETIEQAGKFYKDAVRGQPGMAIQTAAHTGKILPSNADVMDVINKVVEFDPIEEKAIIKQGTTLPDALAAVQGVNMLKQIPKWQSKEAALVGRNLNLAKDTLDEYLEKGFPSFKDARTRYFEANAREAMNHLFAQNKNMTPAFFHMVGQLSLASVGSLFKSLAFSPLAGKAAIMGSTIAKRAIEPAFEPAIRGILSSEVKIPTSLKRLISRQQNKQLQGIRDSSQIGE